MLGAEQRAAHERVDAVGADQHVERGARAVPESRLDAVAVVLESDQAVAEVDALGGHRGGQGGEQVGAVHLVMGEAELGLERLGQRGAEERSAVVPAPLVPGERLDAAARERVGEADAVQHPRRVRADLDAGPDLGQGRRLLIDLDVEPGAQQRECRGQPADAAADDADPHDRPSLAASGPPRFTRRG